ncbi:Rieske 2Fe-2S domain-containing protein [Thiohalocapsa sp.]|uniref:Rieske 2Fe-2S domain-containing protein n=1 Tax=Thiohalocapsa sp. TaxID=2497641 RepID=UPI0025EB18FF|nr:Rieske 2Fe-2S domain-containing protein [Thiohalocapsa sp.]
MAAYRSVQWNRQKLIYDAIMLAGIALYLVILLEITPLFDPNTDLKNLEIRAWGSAAFILMTLILSIGPLCRLDRRFLPLLYNRRHLGVVTCAVAGYHGWLVLGWYHAFGNVEPIVSLFLSNTRWESFFAFPFEWLGVGAWLIMLLMAATSHDFWLANLTAPIWKALHMSVYLAYALIVGHVVLGALQTNTGVAPVIAVSAAAFWVVGLHLLAGWKDRRLDREAAAAESGWIDVCAVDEIPNNRATMVTASGERVAIFRYDGKLSAVSNTCQHQNGPLGEGRIIDGLVTCPWHGFQYDPANGQSPPPFTERVPTFRVRVSRGRVLLDPTPLPAGTRVEPARIDADQTGGDA